MFTTSGRTAKFALASLALCLTFGWQARANAAQELREMYGAAFSVAADPRMSITTLAPDDPLALGFSSLLPPSVAGLNVVKISWPKSKAYLLLAVGASAGAGGTAFGQTAQPDGPALNLVAVQVGDGKPKLVDFPDNMTSGALSRLCIWPESKGTDTSLVLLMSFATSEDDATVVACEVNADGSFKAVDTSGARTLYGWFDVADVDSDGAYELITRRSLDGIPGGLFYRSIRAFSAERTGYAPAPDQYKTWFKGERDWLDWVLSKRDEIQANPAGFESKDHSGPRYTAEYQGQVYSFDTIVDVPGEPGSAGASAARKQALEYIKTYRNELATWLGGGAYPRTWQMAR